MRFSRRRKVDLPQPDGPMRAVTSRGRHHQVDPFEHEVVAEPGAGVDGLEGGGAGRWSTA